jgi:DNA-binding SARP family transcriptional activator
MELHILGSFALSHGGQRWPVSSKRVATVLTLLALSPGAPVWFDRLVDELWGDNPIANERNALQAAVTRSRKLLEAAYGRNAGSLLRIVSTGYVLDVPAAAVDAHRFVACAERGAALVHCDPAAAVGVLEEALAMWSGPALLNTRDGFQSRLEAQRLDEHRLSAYEDLITAKLAVGTERVSVAELQQLALEHGGRERLSELLMLTLYRDGRQTEALEVFHRIRKRLAEETGLEPGRSLHRIYEGILNQDDLLGIPGRNLVPR